MLLPEETAFYKDPKCCLLALGGIISDTKEKENIHKKSPMSIIPSPPKTPPSLPMPSVRPS